MNTTSMEYWDRDARNCAKWIRDNAPRPEDLPTPLYHEAGVGPLGWDRPRGHCCPIGLIAVEGPARPIARSKSVEHIATYWQRLSFMLWWDSLTVASAAEAVELIWGTP